jgi:hypothetical protein
MLFAIPPLLLLLLLRAIAAGSSQAGLPLPQRHL